MKRRKFLKTGLSGSALMATVFMSKPVSATRLDISTCKNAKPATPSIRFLKKLNRKYGGEFGNVMIKE